MLITRAAKIVMVVAIAAFANLVAFGNITDYGTNFTFVRHVLSMDTVFPGSTITYRAITTPALHHAAYAIIIAAEAQIDMTRQPYCPNSRHDADGQHFKKVTIAQQEVGPCR